LYFEECENPNVGQTRFAFRSAQIAGIIQNRKIRFSLTVAIVELANATREGPGGGALLSFSLKLFSDGNHAD